MAIEFSIAFQVIGSIFLILTYFILKDFAKSPKVALLPILIFLAFSYVNVNDAENFALLYILFIVIALLLSFFKSSDPIEEKSKIKIRGREISGTNYYIFNYMIGIFILFLMFYLQSITNGLLIGVPLAIGGFGLIGCVCAAIAENSLMFEILGLSMYISKVWEIVIQKIFLKIPILNLVISIILPMIMLVLPIISIALLFGLWHISAYSARTAGMIFASSVMLLWGVTYKVTGSSSSADVSHVSWNFIIKLFMMGGVVLGA